MSSLIKAQAEKCQDHDKGHCLHGTKCQFEHSKDICRMDGCNNNDCKMRHPVKCKHGTKCCYLRLGGCAYFHESKSGSNLQQFKVNKSGYEMIMKNSTDELSMSREVNSASISDEEVPDHLKFKWVLDPENLATYGLCKVTYSNSYDGKRTKEQKCKVICSSSFADHFKSLIKESDENHQRIAVKACPLDIFKVRCDQVKLVGSERIYKIVNRGLRNHTFEPYFAKEQFQLYAWRVNFFKKKFNMLPYWTCRGDYKEHDYLTVPHQITQNFDYVTELACSKLKLTEAIFFKWNKESSYEAMRLFDVYDYGFPCGWFNFRQKLRFSEKIHMICGAFPNGPRTLEEQSMKRVLEYDIDLEPLPTELVFKSESGMYDCIKIFKRPDFLTKEGKRILENFLYENQDIDCEDDCYCRLFEEETETDDYTDSDD